VSTTTGPQYPQFAPNVAPNASGVTFYLNGIINRTDSTGPAQGSVYEFYPAVSLVTGDVLKAEWRDAAGLLYSATHVVGGGTAPPPPPPPPPPTGTATLTWDAHEDPTVTGYRVYYRVGSTNFASIPVITNNYSLSALASGTWCFTVTAVSPGNESNPSNEACKVIP
jgi:hypothetical protein